MPVVAAAPLGESLVVAPDAAVTDLLDVMQTQGEGRALVMEGPRLAGIVAPSDIARLVTVMRLTAPIDGRASPRKPRVAMWTKSSSGSLEVACRSTASASSSAVMPWPSSLTER